MTTGNLPESMRVRLRDTPIDERRCVVAYCCYIAFRDRTVRCCEVSAVESVARVLEVTGDDVIRIARKVRKRRMKIRKPSNKSTRGLLLQLALWMASIDGRQSDHETKAINRLAKQLQLSKSEAERELRTALNFPHPMLRESASSNRIGNVGGQHRVSMPSKAHAIDNLTQALADNGVTGWLEADLFRPMDTQHDIRRESQQGEIEFIERHSGTRELDIEVNATDCEEFQIAGGSPDRTASLIVGGRCVTQIAVGPGPIEHLIRSSEQVEIPIISTGDQAELVVDGSLLLHGVFR